MNALQIAVSVFLFPLNAFIRLLSATNTMGLYYSMFTLAAVYRLMIVPIIGTATRDAASDLAGRKKTPKSERRRSKRG